MLYKEVDKKYIGCNLKTTELLDCALIRVTCGNNVKYGNFKSTCAVYFAFSNTAEKGGKQSHTYMYQIYHIYPMYLDRQSRANSANPDQMPQKAVSDQNLHCLPLIQGPVVQSVVSLTSSLRVISLTVLVDSIHNIQIFFSKKFQHICVSLHVNFNKSLTNNMVSFE